MRVTCPHCSAAYHVEDARIPEAGSNVRCPKCQNSFPVRRSGGEAASTAVPLPAPARAGTPSAAPFAASGSPFAASDSPFASSDAAFAGADSPFSPVDAPFAASIEVPAPAQIPPAEPGDPFPVPSEQLGFGEVDFGSPPEAPPLPSPSPPPPPDPFPAEDPFSSIDFAPPPLPPLPGSRSPTSFASPGQKAGGAELEPLFGEVGARSQPDMESSAAGFKVRRRSGKVFGPFEAEQIVAMVTKGELLGNEDVSSDGGAVWEAIGSVPRFAEAMRTLTATPEEMGGSTARRPGALAGVPFGDRMAASKVLEGEPEGGGLKRWIKPAIGLGAVLLVFALGATGLLTRHGFFYYKVLRGSGERARIAQLAAQATDLLSRDELVHDQAALAAAEQAIRADDREPLPAALYAVAVASLDRRHAAPPAAVQQARTQAAALASREPDDPAAALAALALATIDGGGAVAGPEAAAERVKGGPSPDGLDLLGEAALGRGDAARAGGLYQKLEAAQPNTVRAARALGQVAAAQGDGAGARAWFEKALARSPNHLPTLLELAALDEAAGELEAAGKALEPLLAKENEARLGPVERARALGVKAALQGRSAVTANAADENFEAALQIDPRQSSLRLALARLRLRRGDPARAVAALEPLASSAAGDPALAELRVRALAAAGRVLDASQLVEAALGRTPGSPPLLVAKGAVLESQAKPAEARKLYEEAVTKAPNEVAPRVALGRLALAEKDLSTAEAALTAAAEEGPRDPAAQSALGDLKAATADTAGAEASYRAALQLDPEYAGAELGLAQLAAARGDTAAARTGLEKVLTLEPRNAAAHAALGLLRWKGGDLEGAEKSYAAAIQAAPKNALAQIRLGAVKLLRSDVAGALEALTTGTVLDSSLAEGQHWLGRALLAKGENPGALARLRNAVELEPKNAVYRLHLGIALEKTNSSAEAVDVYKEAAAADPKFVDPLERLGLLYASAGNCPEAVPFFEKALAIAPRTSRLKLEVADCRLKERKGAEALRLYREVLKADPAEVSVLYKLARALHETQGAAAALPWYEKAAAGDKQNAMPHYYLGYLSKEKGARARAVTEFKAYLALRPDADDKEDIRREIEDLGGTP